MDSPHHSLKYNASCDTDTSSLSSSLSFGFVSHPHPHHSGKHSSGPVDPLPAIDPPTVVDGSIIVPNIDFPVSSGDNANQMVAVRAPAAPFQNVPLPSKQSTVGATSSSSSRTPHSAVDRIEHLFAAGIAATVSTIAVQPLDVLRTRLQVHHVPKVTTSSIPKISPPKSRFSGVMGSLAHIGRTEGLRGLYRGVIPSLFSVVPSISIYFTLYSEFKDYMGLPTGSFKYDTGAQSVAAGLSSFATSAITNPLWVVKTKLQVSPPSLGPGGTPVLGAANVNPPLTVRPHNYSNIAADRAVPPKPHARPAPGNSMFSTIRHIVRNEGIRGLYRGLAASFLTSSQAMIQFPLYEFLKGRIFRASEGLVHEDVRVGASYFSASALAASIACVATYPSEVVRSRLQVQGMHSHLPHKYTSLSHAFRTIVREEGMRGMYRGLGTSLVRLTPAHALSFTTYEFMLRLMREN